MPGRRGQRMVGPHQLMSQVVGGGMALDHGATLVPGSRRPFEGSSPGGDQSLSD